MGSAGTPVRRRSPVSVVPMTAPFRTKITAFVTHEKTEIFVMVFEMTVAVFWRRR